MVSVMLYPCILCVALLMDLFVLGVACLTVFVNCLGVVVILLLNVMVSSVGGGALLDRPCMVFQECACCACDPSVHLSVPSIGFVYVLYVGRITCICSTYVVSLCE